MIIELTGMEYSNASLLDEATACAEAAGLAYAEYNGKRTKFYASDSMFPQTLDVLKTRCWALGLNLEIGPITDFPWD